ncbi:MAG: putative ATPase [Flavobacteriaceae bacterium]|jgi:predicted ATPase
MKIDIHVHTKKCKGGDSEHRNINADKFDEIIRLTDVKILAITNHNHFDLQQYEEIKDKSEDVCQIWPGIELDVLEEDRRAHLIVIANPKNVVKFSETIQLLLTGKTADNFNISIEETVKHFDLLDSIYIAHYYGKKPNLIDEDVDKLIALVSNNKRVLKEATNSISAGIYISHGHNSIYGSDVQNWNDYQNISKTLPDLRLPVQSFDQFCFLLEKDVSTINTVLDKKSKQNIELYPFHSNPLEQVNINVYNDINIIFGSKGTGKSDILHALSKHYNVLGIKNKVYQSSAQTLENSYDLRGNSFDINLSEFGLEDCFQEIKDIRNSSEENVTSLSSYSRYFSIEQTNKIANKLKIQNFTPLDEPTSERDFENISSSLEYVSEFIDEIKSDNLILEIIGDELYQELNKVIQKILLKLKTESEKRILDLRSISLFNQIINVFVEEIAKKTGLPQKPISTGFSLYASNRIRLEKDLKKVLDNISKIIEPNIEFVGNLGEKGELFCQTNLVIQHGNYVNVDYKPVKSATKNPQRNFATILKQIEKHLYATSLFEKITELKKIEGSENINNLNDLLIFYRHFTLNGQEYSPSTGESSMVLLHNELLEDKEIYIIDEPEKSLGNDYISNVIVPMLKEKAQTGKRVIIATHDANIAVRTLPYNSIYREHDINGYYTFQGNPFSNNLVCNNESKVDLDWKEFSMKTLEGGKEAFGERGKIYGNS